MRRMKKVAAATLTAIMVASIAMGTTESWARSSTRAAWTMLRHSQRTRSKLSMMPVMQKMEA